MPQPPAYNRSKDFTENFGSETDHSALNAELDAVSNSVNDIRANLAIIQADDGKLRAGAVTSDSLNTTLITYLINEATQGAATYSGVAQTAAGQAGASETNAASSAASASASATTATTKAAEAAASATTASTAATNAGTSETNAAASATAASNSATAAAGSATSASNSATAAGNSATAAANSATSAGNSASTATTKAGEASTSAANAATSASNAATSETNAAASASAAATSAASINPNILGGMRVMGLTGNVNATTPLTKFDLSASMVTLRNAAGATVTRYTTGTITCDLGLAGSAANGRDQAGAFTANSWIYLYFIWNGTTLATIASTSATAPTLPTGYTHYAFATALRWNASSNIVPVFVSGTRVSYNLAEGGANRVVNGVSPTTMTTADVSALVPPLAKTADIMVSMALSVAANSTRVVFMRMYGASHGGQIALRGKSSSDNELQIANALMFTVNDQKIDYMLNAAVTSGGIYIDVAAYYVPNGDA